MKKRALRSRLPALQRPVEMVIARFNEDIDWAVEWLERNATMTVYDKGKSFKTSKNTSVRQTRLPNVDFGRETHTYLLHIINNYDRLAEWTLFTQGSPEVHSNASFDEALARVDFTSRLQCLTCQYLPGKPDYGCLNGPIRTYGISPETFQVVRPTEWSDPGVDHFMSLHGMDIGVDPHMIAPHFFKSVGLPPKNGTLDFCYGAIMLVHRSRILQHPREVWLKMWKYLMMPKVNGDAPALDCRALKCKGRHFGGYVFERLWFSILGER